MQPTTLLVTALMLGPDTIAAACRHHTTKATSIIKDSKAMTMRVRAISASDLPTANMDSAAKVVRNKHAVEA